MNRKDGTRGGGWIYLQGNMEMVARAETIVPKNLPIYFRFLHHFPYYSSTFDLLFSHYPFEAVMLFGSLDPSPRALRLPLGGGLQ